MSQQCWIIGLDGATLDLVLPWAQAGELPHLAGLLREGAWGELTSTIPPVSFPAWSTLMTGCNPGRHGIFDFTQRRPGRYEIDFINATYRRVPTMWRRASQAGRRVGVMGFPCTYPPEAVNGFMISGFDAPVATGIDRSFVHPPELYAQISPYPLSGIQEVNIGPGWHQQALQQLLWSTERRTEVALQLLQQETWDLFALHYGASDTVAHHFWAFHDPGSPRHDPAVAKGLGQAILQIYRALDRALGRLLEARPRDTVLAVVSDHGSGGSGAWIVHLNRWLAQQGWLRFGSGGPVHRLAGELRRLGLRLPASWQEWAFRGPLKRWVHRLESQNRLGGIDWPRTAAFSEEVNTMPGIWLNLRGREPTGTVAPGAYEDIRQEIGAALEHWRHPETGAPLVRRVWKREELYEGPWVDLAPDIVLEPALDRGYSLTFLSSGGGEGPALRRLGPEEYWGAKGGSMNGSHRRQGMLILAGPGVRRGQQLAAASLEDIAPTVLAVMGLACAEPLDGNVLSAAFEPGALPKQEPLERDRETAEPQPYTAEESSATLERLRGLGYRE
ncbi:MAG: alkaline phosphatase family protein [Chloroflexia bacterium]|nr:alkaline phosphatase family protein [Chloroflexia bacterium]